MLDPSSPTLITDWATQVTGRSFHPRTVGHMLTWLERKTTSFKAMHHLHRVASPFPDVLLLKQRENDRSDRYYMSWQGSQFYDAGIINFAERNKNDQLRGRIGQYRDHLEQFEGTGIQVHKFERKGSQVNLSERFAIAGFPTFTSHRTNGLPNGLPVFKKHDHESLRIAGLALPRLIDIARKHGAEITPGQILALTAALPKLRMSIRHEMRKPARQIIAESLETADRDALAVMRRIHNFDNRLYGYMVSGANPETCLKRRQFVQAFPSLAEFTHWDDAASAHLRTMIDKGIPLTGASGLEAIASVLSEKTRVPISTRTARGYASLHPVRHGLAILKLATLWLDTLDGIDPAQWPRTVEGFSGFENHLFPLGHEPAAAQRLVRETAGDWSGLKRKADKSIRRRLVAVAENELYREEQWARLEGRRPAYLFPPPLPDMAGHVGSISQRIGDYLNMVLKEAVVPAGFADTARGLSHDDRNRMRSRMMAAAPYRQLVEASEKWHEPRRARRLQADLQRLNPSLEKGWLPIVTPLTIPEGTVFASQPIGGLKFVVYTKPSQLTVETEEMGHCIYSYVPYCLLKEGASHILSLRDSSDRRLSTVELVEYAKEDPPLRSGQNKTYGDAMAPPQALAAGQWLVNEINAGRLAQASTPLAREARRQELREAEAQRMAHLARDPVLLQATYDTVRRAAFPQAWRRFQTPAEFLQAVLPEPAMSPKDDIPPAWTAALKKAAIRLHDIRLTPVL